MNLIKKIKEFSAIRNWGAIRGLQDASPQIQFQRCLQEVCEIHEAITNDDQHEFIDALGDTLVTLVTLAETRNVNLEDGIKQAFDVIELRKGLVKNGSFVRYMKLNKEDQNTCDILQGSVGLEYFTRDKLQILGPLDFVAE